MDKKEIAIKVGARIKNARKVRGFTQGQVGKILNLTQQQYSRFENGKYELNYYQIYQVCDLFNVTPNDLFIKEEVGPVEGEDMIMG